MVKEKSNNPALAAHKARKEKERLKTQQSRLNSRLLIKLKSEGTARNELQAKIDKLSKSKGVKSKSKATSRVRKKLQELMALQKMTSPDQPKSGGAAETVFDRVERIARGEEVSEDEDEDIEEAEVKLNVSLTEKFLQGRLNIEALKEERQKRSEKSSWMVEDMKRRVAGQIVSDKNPNETRHALDLPGNDTEDEDEEDQVGVTKPHRDAPSSTRENETASPPLNETASPPLNETASPPLNETASPSLKETASPPLNETASPPLNETPVLLEDIKLEDLPPPPSIDSLMQACLMAQPRAVPRPPSRMQRLPPPPPSPLETSPFCSRPPPPPSMNFPRPPSGLQSNQRAPPPPLFVPSVVQRGVTPNTFGNRAILPQGVAPAHPHTPLATHPHTPLAAHPHTTQPSGDTFNKTLQFLDFLKSLPPTTTSLQANFT